MKRIHPLTRATLGFLFGVLALVTPFIILGIISTLRANISHGTPSPDDYRFGAAAIALLTAGFAGGAALLGQRALTALPPRVAGIAGAAATTTLLIVMMLIGETLGLGGALAVATAAGLTAASLLFRVRHAPRPVVT